MGAQDLSLDLNPIFIPKTISEFLGGLMNMNSVTEKILAVDDYVHRLETEIIKIHAFERELPLCKLLMNDAIEALKEELMVFRRSVNAPVIEEFIPIKKRCEDEVSKFESDLGDKKNWLSSTQLCTNPKQSLDQVVKKRSEERDMMVNKFIPFKEDMPVSGLSLISPGIKNPMRGNVYLAKNGANDKLVSYTIPDVRSDIQIGGLKSQPTLQPTSRKQRRCWSPELHRRFVNALQQLGGSKAATPKQIRELMQVDGLTNDEVKSHLQKYRLHNKRFPSGVTSGASWAQSHDHYLEKQSNSQSGSPDGPLLHCTTGGTSTTGGDSMDDCEDERSENNCWKGHLYTSGKETYV